MNDDSHLLSIVIPAFNEENGIGTVLTDLKEAFPDAQIIVVDDGSSDQTGARAAEHSGVEVWQHPFNRGYGASLRTGMKIADREYVAWFDADNEHRREDLAAMFARIRTERLAAVIGQRAGKSVTLTRAVGKFVIRTMGRALNLNAGNDLNCGLRIFRTRVISGYLSLLPERYSASLTTTMLMVERRYPIAFHTVHTNQRIGSSKVRLRDGMKAMSKLIRLTMLFAPMRIFFRLGAVLAIAGMIYGVVIAFAQGLGFPVAGMLAVTVGVVLCMLGLVADQISQFWLSGLGATERPLRLHTEGAAVRRVSATKPEAAGHEDL